MNGGSTHTERLISLWDHLGLKAARVAVQMPADIADVANGLPMTLANIGRNVPFHWQQVHRQASL